MKKTLCFFIVIIFPLITFGQQEASNWYFGFGAGMQFNQGNGTITVVDDGMLSTNEGCSSISDENGNLLFYSDGTTVWNRNHDIMQNGTGLFGDSSSTQSAIIVQKPNDTNIYYIFTVDNALDGNNFGLNYSEVDMTLDGGLGGITNKNVNLLPLCSEKISAVLKDCVTGSIWVITFANQTGNATVYDAFHAFEVTDLGVDNNAIVSTFNINITDARGYLKLSPDGTKLANANASGGMYLYDFDVNTGIVSNQQQLLINTTSDRPYGVEFSGNNQFLYVHSSNDYFNQQNPSENGNPANHFSTLTQFDVSIANVQASEITLDQQNLYRGGLQLGPDGRIYRALSSTYSSGTSFLGVINNPNLPGFASNYQHNAINLAPNLSSQGLPPFMQSLFNEQIDIIQNGVSSVNLDLCTGDIYTLISDDIPGATYTWTLDGNPLPETDFDLVVDQTGHYEVSIDQNNGDCAIEGQAFVTYFNIPVANQPNNLLICDDNNDQQWSFDFTVMDAEILGTQNNTEFIVKYFESQPDADNNINEILGNYNNLSNPQTIYVRVENMGNPNCYDTTSFDFEIFDSPIANHLNDLVTCDDDLDGNNLNGQAETDLFALNSQVLGLQNDTEYAVTYHSSQNDADINSNPLSSPYYNSTPFQELIFVRIENINNPSCYDTTFFNIVVNPIPETNNAILFQCDEDGIPDGFTLFNLTEADADLTLNANNASTKFFTSLVDAENSQNEIDGNSFSNFSNPQTIYVQIVDNITGCFGIGELTLEVSATNASDAILEACDDDGTEDGLYSFNLLDAEPTVLNGLPTDLEVSYYETYENALLETNELNTTFTNTNPYSQTIYVRVENENACYGINQIQLNVLELPNIETDFETLYCLNFFPETITLFGGVINDLPNNYYYNWSTGENTSQIEVNQPGTYSVTVSNVNGCSKIRSIRVLPSNIASIENIEVMDASQNNTILVLVSGEGDYEYALDDINGPYFNDNLFENVAAGIHTVFVRDKNGCGISEDLVSVIGFPKFFSPNGDGYNDTWQIKGVSSRFQPSTLIYIFDRYGKLITKLDPLSTGWNGTINGNPMPSDDYWFAITLQDGRIYKDHFALIR